MEKTESLTAFIIPSVVGFLSCAAVAAIIGYAVLSHAVLSADWNPRPSTLPAPAPVKTIEDRAVEIAADIEKQLSEHGGGHVLCGIFKAGGSVEIVFPIPPRNEWTEFTLDEIAFAIQSAIERGCLQFLLIATPEDPRTVVGK